MSADASNQPAKSYTGRGRRKQTRWTVRAADVVAKWVITVGGIGTIVAVSVVFLFLGAVVAPLFWPAAIDQPVSQPMASAVRPLAIGLDEFRTSAWMLRQDGQLELRRIETGESIRPAGPLVTGPVPTSVSTSLGQPDAVVAFADGSIRVGRILFEGVFPDPAEVSPDVLQLLDQRRRTVWNDGVLERTTQGQLRQQRLTSQWSEPIALVKGSIQRLDHLQLGGGDGIGAKEFLVACATTAGKVYFSKLAEEQNALTGESTYQPTTWELPAHRSGLSPLIGVYITGRGDNVFLVWEDGLATRIDVREPSQPVVQEHGRFMTDPDVKLTAVELLLGRETLVCGDSAGAIHAWFRVRAEDSKSLGLPPDGQRLRQVHTLSTGNAAVTSLRPSERSRMVAAGYADGTIRVWHVTTEREVLAERLTDKAGTAPILEVAIAPKEDGLFALTANQMWTASFEPRHPDASFAAIFRPVWYEGYDRPTHQWQSSFATSAPEPKFGLVPLVFGTLKATFYAMVFAVPLALLAAIFSSEFLRPQVRAVFKPAIEMMASLPSVVLGFLAALVIAATVEAHVSRILCSIFTIPVSFLLAAHLWPALPASWTIRLQSWRIVFLPIPLVAGVVWAAAWGSTVERWLFAGDILRWLDGQVGNGIGAWMFLLLPLSAALVTAAVGTIVNPWLRGWAADFSRQRFVWLNLLKSLTGVLLTVALAYGCSWLLDFAGFDPRGSYLGTYVQRNAFVVGMVMGFAVIPIIFTLADDALSTVPQHLRSASLGCGATPWQTAFRVVIPTAMSGLFSAIMIGLGRAVGETMVVLMAGGNTPVMEWNLFNGFRTMSANIAVELPEAVRDSTHYRTLFLAALTLFLMTFVLNTIAEMVRTRFRKRAFQL